MLLITTAVAQVGLTPTLPLPLPLALPLTPTLSRSTASPSPLTLPSPSPPPASPEQVNYINRGMVNFGNSQLIPAHYVTFTLFSVLATSTFYQEFEVDEPLHLHFFVDGIRRSPSPSSSSP